MKMYVCNCNCDRTSIKYGSCEESKVDREPRSSFFVMYGTVQYFVCCVWSANNQDRSFFSQIRSDLETDHSSAIDEFTTDKNDGPMEHDGFGGGESIGAGGGAMRWAEPSEVHASHELRHDRV